MTLKAQLYLIPVPLSNDSSKSVSLYRLDEIANIKIFFVENEKTARKHLKCLLPLVDVRALQLLPLNEHTHESELIKYIEIIRQKKTGIISEAGLPCVADPGAQLVRLAHHQDIEIIPLIGPSSLMLALMASGLNGQNFVFNGYLPKDKTERLLKIKELDKNSLKNKQTQIFIETPYRNDSIFAELLEYLNEQCRLTLAVDLTSSKENIRTKTIKEWKIQLEESFNKRPCVFLFGYH